jgi:hypothetical protein
MKIFGIGLARTGTTSLARALRTLGYKTLHAECDILKIIDDNLVVRPEVIEKYDAIIGTPLSTSYETLDNLYDAKFIYTQRRLNTWLESCEKMFVPELPIDDCHIKLHDDLYGSKYFDREKFNAGAIKHADEVMKYFNGKDNFLALGICEGEGWDKLCGFLEKSLPIKDFPHLSKTRKT